jgi:hypothetical protein
MLQLARKKLFRSRHSDRDCRNPDYKDVLSLPSMVLDTRFPAGMTNYFVSAESSF